ncbi:recombinase family protein [Gordonia humi]|uniref:DNA invertase Pin-like site-specific DNA recombinase n=1 Tax=Gordonia humi TaxID=686429 RepID=A0A840F5T0_9ACTN|nr:recombinase family protein [Gordonia humi]MBB4137246.1 DNA invertase Pin-like site-specific DNA recombinase [Gordonia humi]
MSRVAFYARVSTKGQSLDQQRDALAAARITPDREFAEKLSGKAGVERPEYTAAVDWLHEGGEGGVLVVAAIDRLGRSVAEVATTIAELTAAGIAVRSLRDGVDTSTSAGRLVANVMISLAEYELEVGRERRAASRAARKARGLNPTRPHKMSPTARREIAERYRDGEPLQHLMAAYGVGRSTVIRYAREHGCLKTA